MFNFYPNRKSISFKSNPSLPPLEVVEPLLKDGVVTNHVRVLPRDNKSLLYGAHFDPDTMSLRALLFNGVQLNFVSNDSLENDPSVVYNRIKYMSNTITTKYASLITSQSQTSQSQTQESK